MKSIAITDHGVVQAFPEAKKASEKFNIKIIYGVEAYIVLDNKENIKIPEEYCVFDIETTGLAFRTEKITEIGAIKVKNGKVIDTFETFVNPEKKISEEITKITKITNEMVENEETIDKILPKFLEFIGNNVLVAHNAEFDLGFIKYNSDKLKYKFENKHIDTLELSRKIFCKFKRHRLGDIAENLGIKIDVAHRALDDSKTLFKIFEKMKEELEKNKNKDSNSEEQYKKMPSYHALILVKNLIGLKNLYKLISLSHLNYFYKKPKILKSIYEKYKEGLIIGTACEQGELYRSIISGKNIKEIEKIAKEYDFLEIQPIENNIFMLRNGTVEKREDLEEINKKIVVLGEKLEKLVVATGDVHFLNPEDEIYRRILMSGQGYSDADNQAPLYLKTTQEMLDEFSYLGKEKAYEVVITNTNKIDQMCEMISPISSEKCPPHIEGAETEIEKIAMRKSKRTIWRSFT